MGKMKAGTVAGLSHAAIRTKNIPESIRFYTEVLGLEEAFRMNAEDGSLATVYLFLAPGQYLELFAGGAREGISGPDVTGTVRGRRPGGNLRSRRDRGLPSLPDDQRCPAVL